MIVLERYAKDHSLTLGSPLQLKTPTGKVVHLQVEGIADPPKGGSPFGELTVSTAVFDASFANHDNELTLLNVEGGVDRGQHRPAEGRRSPRSRMRRCRRVTSSRTAQLGDLTSTLNILYVLLGLSVIVSLFGVINTLVLSVFERTRELGMLRAIGMTRRQVRRMVRHESIVTALIGAALGIAVGIFLAGLVDARALAVRDRVRDSVRVARRLRRRRDPRRDAGRDPARPPRLAAERPRGAAVRVIALARVGRPAERRSPHEAYGRSLSDSSIPGGAMYARVAQFESDADSLDQMVSGIRESLDRGR